jgi:hypothetical protein
MEATNLPSDAHEASSSPPAVTNGPRRSGRWLRWIPLALAVLWLIASVIVGVQLMQHDPEEVSALDVTAPKLSASSEHVFYGGDAYTGIQNAAADTEHAVVDGVNQLGAFQLALQKAVADQENRQSASVQTEMQKGLGFLIIGVGVLNVTVALTRLRKSD